MQIILLILTISTISGMICFGFWDCETPSDVKDYSIGNILATTVLFPGILLVKFFLLFLPLLKSKPFKKSRFSVGEEVMFNGKPAKIIKNEKQCEGTNVLIKMKGDYFERLVDAKSVKKLTKLEQALK